MNAAQKEELETALREAKLAILTKLANPASALNAERYAAAYGILAGSVSSYSSGATGS